MIWEDYYKILDADISDNFDVIFDKYKESVRLALQDRENGQNVDTRLLLIEEAGRVFFNDNLRELYDTEYKLYAQWLKDHPECDINKYKLSDNELLQFELSDVKRLALTTVGDIGDVCGPPILKIVVDMFVMTWRNIINFFKRKT